MATINPYRIRDIAEIIRNAPEHSALNFYSYEQDGKEVPMLDQYPALHDRATIRYFFFQCLHNFGFWNDDGEAYLGPLYGSVGGRRSKGSELLGRILMRRLAESPQAFDPEYLKLRATRDWPAFFADDNGAAFPDMERRRELTLAYAEWFIAQRLQPDDIVADANVSSLPLAMFLEWMRRIPGFDLDPFQKRARLLALSLARRPERLLRDDDCETAELPIIDYHLMRVALRTGMVELSPEERGPNVARLLVTELQEASIREQTFSAMCGIQLLSRRRLAVVDNAFWQARRYCPEMEPPKCDQCVFASCCAKRTELFQPVRRTDWY